MNIETQPRDDHQVRLVVNFDPEQVEKYRRRAARKIAEKAKIPGFRPGKAPYDVIRRVYGDEALNQEAIDLLVDDEYPKVLEQAGVKPSGPGKLDEIVNLEPLCLAFLVPLEPVVELGDYHALRQDYLLEPVTEEQIDQVVNNMLKNSATAEPVDRPSKDGDVVYINLHGIFTSPNEGETMDAIRESSYQFVVADETDIWPYDGFTHQLSGLSVGDQKIFVYTYPEDSRIERLRGREVQFTISVNSVKSFNLPEVNEEFVQGIDPSLKSVDELRSEIRRQLEERKREEYEETYVSTLLGQILATAVIKYPPTFIDDEVEHMVEHFEEDLARQKMDLNAYLKSRQLDRDSFIEAEIRPIARQRLERNLILSQIAREENIQVNAQELQAEVIQTMTHLQQAPDYQTYARRNQVGNLVNAIAMNTASRLLNRDTINHLIAIARGQYPPVEQEAAPAPEVETSAQTELSADEAAPKKKRKAKKQPVETTGD